MKNCIAINNANNIKKLYFVNFEFICGEYEQIFGKVFYAKNEKDLRKKIHNYLVNYYGDKHSTEITNDAYYYWGGEVGSKCVGWHEVKNFKGLISELL